MLMSTMTQFILHWTLPTWSAMHLLQLWPSQLDLHLLQSQRRLASGRRAGTWQEEYIAALGIRVHMNSREFWHGFWFQFHL